MNTRTAPTVVSFLGAAVLTIAMLAGIDGLATSQPAAPALAQAASATATA